MRQANLWATEFEYRRTLLKVLLLIIVVVGAIFTIHNWSVGLYILAIVEFATICFAMGVLSIHKTSKNIHFWASAFLATLYLVILFGVYASKFSASLYSWLFIIPVLSYLLLGTKRGNIFSAVFVSLGIAVLYAKHINSDGAVPFIAILNVLFCILAIWGLSYTYESKRASMVKQLQNAAALDPLTNLYNRLNFESIFSSLCQRAHKEDTGVAMLLLDLDHFKSINDQYGHIIGDKVLKEVSSRITNFKGNYDCAFRLGGEEFCLLIFDTREPLTSQVAENLRKAIMSSMEIDGHQLSVKVSIGVSHWTNDDSHLSQVYQLADERLYKAKSMGRNTVVSS